MRSRPRDWRAAAAGAALALAAVAGPAAAEGACERTCEVAAMDRLLAALVSHQPAAAGLTEDVRYTENGQALALGDGFWGTASAIGAYRHYFTDPRAGQVGFFGVMRENGDPVLVVVRLKLRGDRISEIETIVSRTEGAGPMGQGPAMLERLGRPNPIWDQPVPPSERMSRDDLIAVANSYFTTVQQNDGRGDYLFAPDCYRLENGMQTTGPSPISLSNPPPPKPGQPAGMGPTPDWGQLGCEAQFRLGWFRFVDRIRDRRFMVVDPEHGTVFALGFFDHSGTVHDYALTNGVQIRGGGVKEPYTWEIGEAFRIEHGKIRLIEAVMTRSPYGMRPNWPDQPAFGTGAGQ